MTQTENKEEQQARAFNPHEHTIQLKSKEGAKDYLPVQYRLVWFREKCPDGTIETEMVLLDLDRETEEEGFAWNNETRRSEKIIKRANGLAIFRTIAKDGKGGVATGYKSEKAASFPDFIEKAETGSIGRALAALGYGTQFAPELNEEHRIVDAPVEHTSSNGNERQPLASVRPSTMHQDGQETGQDVKKSKHTQNQETGQETHPSGSNAVLQRMIEQAQVRAAKLGIPWDRVKGESLGEQLPDEKLVTGHFTKINGYLTKKERGEAA